jgi:hypothetical protein
MSTSSNAQQPVTDFCSFVPDAPFGFDFSGACALHDQQYGADSMVTRWDADREFYNNLQTTCDVQYGGSWLCHLSAAVYYIGVRLFGASFFEGPNGG